MDSTILLRLIQANVRAGNFVVGTHVLMHGATEGFIVSDVVAAVLTGSVIEHYPARDRCLLCAQVQASNGKLFWLHVACSYQDPSQIAFIAAYIPEPNEWEQPPIRRKH